jgi:nitrous oxidase accessory protein NosD
MFLQSTITGDAVNGNGFTGTLQQVKYVNIPLGHLGILI